MVEGKEITPAKVRNLTEAASRAWDAIMARDLGAFARAFADSFDAQVAMFPAMMQPGVQEYIDRYAGRALAWKMLGAGGGGHLALVLPDGAERTEEMIDVKIRRKDSF